MVSLTSSPPTSSTTRSNWSLSTFRKTGRQVGGRCCCCFQRAFGQIASSFFFSLINHHPRVLLSPALRHRRDICAGVQADGPCGGGGGGGRRASQHLPRLHHAGQQRDRRHHGEGQKNSGECSALTQVMGKLFVFFSASDSEFINCKYCCKKILDLMSRMNLLTVEGCVFSDDQCLHRVLKTKSSGSTCRKVLAECPEINPL